MDAKISSYKTVLFVSLLMLISGLLGALLTPIATGRAGDAYQYAAIDVSATIEERDQLFKTIYERVAPSVVSITVGQRSRVAEDRFFDASTGSGFVIDTEGHIVTNSHVVDGADRLEVRFFDGTITRAELIGTDNDSDLAVIQVDLPPQRLLPVILADSSAVHVGQTVLAIGNPFENDWTLTSGIVSALNRRIVGLNLYSIGGVIQTDAAINPGNSGGPLLNLRGEVVGVNSQIESGIRQNSGIGFAVPSNLVQRVADDLIAEGFVNYSYLGITDEPITLDLIERYELPNNIRGAAVRAVRLNYPASNAGLRNATIETIDIITAIDGTPINNFDELVGYLAINTEPGQTITMTVYRNGQVLALPLTLGARPNR